MIGKGKKGYDFRGGGGGRQYSVGSGQARTEIRIKESLKAKKRWGGQATSSKQASKQCNRKAENRTR